MTTARRMALSVVILAGLMELTGCASPPPPRSAKKEISTIETALTNADDMCKRKMYADAKAEIERANAEIIKAQEFASGNESTRLDTLASDAREKKFKCEQELRRQAVEASLKPKTAPATTAVTNAKPAVDPEVTKREEEKAKEVKLAAEQKAALEIAGAAKTTKKKTDEPEDAGDGSATVKTKAQVKKDEAGKDEPEAPKVAKKDKQGIFPDVTAGSPPLEVVKLTRVGRFVVAYVQIYNKSDEGKRISVSNFFKNTDNQTAIDPRTTVSFPYENFSLKVKDLIADQSLRNFTANSQEVRGNEYIQFVSVGECQTEELAVKINRLYVNVIFNDGKSIDATGPSGNTAGAAIDKALPKLLK